MAGKKLEPWVTNDVDVKKYVLNQPRFTVLGNHEQLIKNQLFPDHVYLDSNMLDGAQCYIHQTFRYAIPDPEPIEWAHTHDFIEIVSYIGTDPWHPYDLGATIDFYIDDKPIRFDTTSYVYIPAGVRHCPHIHIEIKRPYMLQVFLLGKNAVYPEQPIPDDVQVVEGFPFILGKDFLTVNPDPAASLEKYPDK